MRVVMRAWVLLTASLIIVANARGQSFNIDIDTNIATVPGIGVPSSSFGGAANQPGVWNSIKVTTPGPYALVGLDGATTTLSLSRTNATGGSYGFDNANTSDNFARLLDDAQDIGASGPMTYTIGNLAAGNYMIFVYAAAPDSATTVSSVRLLSPITSAVAVGGAIPVNSFVEGVTHAVFERTLTALGSINIQVTSSIGAGRCNGIQVVRRQFVSATATGANDGRSWTSAFTDLQSALNSGTGQVWVAAGAYKPAASTRTTSFQLQNSLSVFGGFTGTESRLEQRNTSTNPTILTGNIGIITTDTDNSYHVVQASSIISATASLDGFTIASGNANGATPDNRGGGMLISGSPIVRNCVITNNNCTSVGGGIYSTGSPVLINCEISSNHNSGSNGGGIHAQSGTFALVNSAIVQNTTTIAGGGLYATTTATASLYNCIINGNIASTNDGGGIRSDGSLNTLNCTFVNNIAGTSGGAIRITTGGASIFNCLIRNNIGTTQIYDPGNGANVTNCNVQGGYAGTNNIDANPLFADLDGPDNIAGNIDDDLRILSGSPCANTGSTSLLPSDVFDLDGDGVTTELLPLDFRARPRVAGTAVDIGAYEQTHVYVNDDAPGANNGSSWTDAYRQLKGALTNAQANSEEIWIAAGTYVPSVNSGFSLPMGVTIYGGFAGTETALSQRNVKLNPVILSGADNLSHVVRVAANVSQVVVDGVTVSNGNDQVSDTEGGSGLVCYGSAILRNCTIAHNKDPNGGGGGIRNLGGLTLDNCEISFNQAGVDGGGINNSDSGTLTVNKCLIQNNEAAYGGGIHSDGTFVMTACSVRHNNAVNGGGGVTAGGFHSFTVENSIFLGNEAPDGGGMRVFAEPSLIRNCTFSGNAALGGRGGGLYVGTAVVANSIFWGNMGWRNSELAIYPTATLSNCVVARGLKNAVVFGLPPGANWINNLEIDPKLTPDGHLRSDSPCINAGSNVSASATDIDGEARPAGGIVDIGADEFIDSESSPDGLPDAWELRYFDHPTSTLAGADSDSDTFTNLQEYQELGSAPNLLPIYVSPSGSDANSGSLPTFPKQTIQAALDAIADRSTIRLLNTGVSYSGSLNRNLNTHGKAVIIAGAFANQPIIDCGGWPFFADTFENSVDQSTLFGMTITNAAAFASSQGRRLQLRSCLLNGNSSIVNGRAFGVAFGHLTVTGGSAAVNLNVSPKDVLEHSQLQLLSDWTWTSGPLDMYSSMLYGAGSLKLGSAATLAIKGTGSSDVVPPTIAYTNILGTGNITIDADQELRLVNGAIIDLSGATGISSCACSAPVNAGTITVNGRLTASGGHVQNTNVIVNQSNLGEGGFIIHNDISMPQVVPANGMTPGFGGEFFVENNSTICCNHIVSYGDRYLDIDPLAESQNPTISNNTIDVIITQSTADGQGELLELRAYDFDAAMPCPGWPAPCAMHLTSSNGYNDTWTINKLEIMPDARVTLTNRKNFEFNLNPQPPHPPVPTRDSIYVRQLVLHPNAVLNIGLQRLYYQTLVDESETPLTPNPNDPNDFGGGRRIIDVPLLGFSLKVINFEDPTPAPANEFDIRMRTRVQDDPSLDPSQLSTPLGEAARTVVSVSGQPQNAMTMDTQANGHPAVSMVAAKGAFARCGEDEVEITFLYDFDTSSSSDAVLSLYLSDSPEQGENLGPLLATIRPPAAGPGSILDTNFATFRGKFSRGNLDLRRGTYIELRLTGTNARVYIDDFDPLVCGSSICGDIGGAMWYDWAVTSSDFLYLLAQQGNPVGSNTCVDNMSSDQYVDIGDMLQWDAQFNTPNMNLCSNFLSGASTPPDTNVSIPNAPLLIAGKQRALLEISLQASRYPVRLFGLTQNSQGATALDGILPPLALDPLEATGFGRLMRAPNGVLHQVHGAYGLIRLDNVPDNQDVRLAPGSAPYASSQVHIGVAGPGDVPILDVAFHPTNPNIVFVAPVRVVPDTNSVQDYLAAAQVMLNANSGTGWTIQKIYGRDPWQDPEVNTLPPILAQLNVQKIREIETDSLGNVYVISAMADNSNNWLLTYVASTADELRTRLTSGPVDPTAMLVTADGSNLYLASGQLNEIPTISKVYRYSINHMNSPPSVSLDGIITISDMRQVTALTQDASGEIIAVGYRAPDFAADHTFSEQEPLFTIAAVAKWPASSSPQTVPAQTISGGDLALPLSVVRVDPSCPGPRGDFNGDGVVALTDLSGFLNVMLNGTGGSAQALCRADYNADGQANGRDISGFVQAVLHP